MFPASQLASHELVTAVIAVMITAFALLANAFTDRRIMRNPRKTYYKVVLRGQVAERLNVDHQESQHQKMVMMMEEEATTSSLNNEKEQGRFLKKRNAIYESDDDDDGDLQPGDVIAEAGAAAISNSRHKLFESSVEYELYNNLIGSKSRYLKQVRPVLKHNDAVIVEVGMSVMMIEELIEREQIMIMAAAIKMKWTDNFLAWEPEEYGNLTWTTVSSDLIWVPDISIVNSPEPFSMTRKVTHVDINHNGEVGYYPSGRLTTRCNLHITYFPFDHQYCEVFLESWIHPSEYLKILPYETTGATVDIKEYYKNHQWAIISYEVNIGSADYDGKNFSSITFVYMLKRKSEYYFMYFIFPQLMLAFLQTLSHTLPVEHPGRMTMLTSLFIGTSVTQSAISVHIPKSSETMSLLQIYMILMSVNLAVALIITFVIKYSVLRYPAEEPSLTAIVVAFFSIVWPEKMCEERGAMTENTNDYFRRQRRASYAPVLPQCNNNRSTSKLTRLPSVKISLPSQHEQLGKSLSSNGPSTSVLRLRRLSQRAVVEDFGGNVTAVQETSERFSCCSPANDEQQQVPPYDDVEILLQNRKQSLAAASAASSQYERKRSWKRRPLRERTVRMALPRVSITSSFYNRGQAATPEETRSLKQRWLLYCVALDKTIMYANAAWNIAVPLVLFIIIPATAAPLSLHLEYASSASADY